MAILCQMVSVGVSALNVKYFIILLVHFFTVLCILLSSKNALNLIWPFVSLCQTVNGFFSYIMELKTEFKSFYVFYSSSICDNDSDSLEYLKKIIPSQNIAVVLSYQEKVRKQ